MPAPKRRWGYYVLPLLYGDRFVGRIEPRVDRASATLRVVGLWWEAGFDPLVARTGGSSRASPPRCARTPTSPAVAKVRAAAPSCRARGPRAA